MVNTLIRLSDELARHASDEAARLGLSFDELVSLALEDLVEMPADRRIRILAEAAAFVDRNFSPECFPANVVLRVFHHIRGDRRLMTYYEAAIQDEHGRADHESRVCLNRQITSIVIRRLEAEETGKHDGLCLDADLVESVPLVRPTQF